MTVPSVRLVSGHPDDENAEASATAALAAEQPPYTTDWPRETALRYLNALSTGDRSHVRITTPPSEKELVAFLRARTAEHMSVGLSLFEAVLGSERVASEIVSSLERGSASNTAALVDSLAVLRERMPVSDRSRLDARLRVLSRTSVVPAIEAMLSAPKRVTKAPKAISAPPPAAPKKPAAKKKAKKK